VGPVRRRAQGSAKVERRSNDLVVLDLEFLVSTGATEVSVAAGNGIVLAEAREAEMDLRAILRLRAEAEGAGTDAVLRIEVGRGIAVEAELLGCVRAVEGDVVERSPGIGLLEAVREIFLVEEDVDLLTAAATAAVVSSLAAAFSFPVLRGLRVVSLALSVLRGFWVVISCRLTEVIIGM